MKRIIFDIPLGKINTDGVIKNQGAQKEEACWYYTLNYLRTRYDKTFVNQKNAERVIEKILSSHRKNIRQIEKEAVELTKLSEPPMYWQTEESSKDKDYIQRRLDDCLLNTPFLTKRIEVFNNFLAQSNYEDFDEYSYNYIEEMHILNCRKTLINLGLNPKETYETYCKLTDYPPVPETLATYSNIIYLEAIKRYGLEYSNWHPSLGINGLFDELEKNGPLALTGKYGETCWGDSKHIPGDFNKRPFYSWDFTPAETFSETEQDAGHAILIIGAEKNESGEFVYFLDPNDSSDNSKIYQIPYTKLISEICDIYANLYTQEDMKDTQEMKAHFAVYSHKKHYNFTLFSFSAGTEQPQKMDITPSK